MPSLLSLTFEVGLGPGPGHGAACKSFRGLGVLTRVHHQSLKEPVVCSLPVTKSLVNEGDTKVGEDPCRGQ